MNPFSLHTSRQTLSAISLAVATTLAVLLAMGALADRYHADERVAQAASAPAARG
jgi:hypothetical protein